MLTLVQAFIRPMGTALLFKGASGNEKLLLTPPLEWVATHPLIDTLGSRLVVLRKSAIPAIR
jgi:hypothetical protein